MCSYLRVNLIQYECTCKYLYPLCHLYFCRKCNRIRCPLCLNEEIDILFCPHCLENNSLTDSKYVGGKYFCSNCYQCPLCGNFLLNLEFYKDMSVINKVFDFRKCFGGKNSRGFAMFSSMQRLFLDNKRFEFKRSRKVKSMAGTLKFH